MAEQLFTDGDVHEVNGQTLECVATSYQETDGERSNFVYHFRLKSDLDAEREAAKAAELPAETTEPVTQPEQPQEETQYVK